MLKSEIYDHVNERLRLFLAGKRKAAAQIGLEHAQRVCMTSRRPWGWNCAQSLINNAP